MNLAVLVKQLIVEANSAVLKLENEGLKYAYKLYHEGVHVGYVRQDIWSVLERQPETRELVNAHPDQLEIKPNLTSERFNEILFEWHKLKSLEPLKALRNWRNEQYGIQSVDFEHDRSMQPQITIERAASSLFGTRSFGCHLNGYVRTEKGEVKMWIARRSKAKQNYPGMLDNLVGGGLPVILSALNNMVKESHEEAGISGEVIRDQATLQGSISFLQDATRGIVCETDFIYDLELPSTFKPNAVDGEVEDFYLMTFSDIVKRLENREFTPESGLIIVDFILRHRIIDLPAQTVAELSKSLRTGLETTSHGAQL